MNECDLFIAALDKPSLQERQAFLDEACGGNRELRRRLETLLASHGQSGSLLEHPALDRNATVATSRSDVSTSGEGTSSAAGSLDDVRLDFLTPDEDGGGLGRLGCYRVTGIIGRGGMGVVLKAHDAKLNRTVAIKVLAPELASSASARQRFIREAQAAAAVVHPHVVTIHAVEDTPWPHLVMEYIDGPSLQEKIDCGRLRAAEIVRIGWEIANGLRAAHAQGLVHRDIKPANILLESGEERSKITDFGLAHAVDDARTTQAGTIVGTPQYMSPEQALGQPVDQRSDLFSLGSVLYAMCTGRCPFQADSTVAALRRVCDDTPQAILELNPHIPPWLCQLIGRLLAKEQAERIQTAGEVVELLVQRMATPQHSGAEASAVKAEPVRVGTRARQRRGLSMAGAALLAAVGGLLILDMTRMTHFTATWKGLFSRRGPVVAPTNNPDMSEAVEAKGDRGLDGGGPFQVSALEEIGRWQAHSDRVIWLEISSDGRQLVSASKDRTARVWDLASREQLQELIGHRGIVEVARFSPDGKTIATASDDRSVRWWNAGSGEMLGVFGEHTGIIRNVEFDPEGKSLFTAGGEDYTLRRIDLGTGEGKVLEKFNVRVRSLALDDRILAVGTWGDGLVRFWNIDTEIEQSRIYVGGAVAETMAFHPGGKLLAEGGYAPLHLTLCDVGGGGKSDLSGHTITICGVAFSLDGRQLISVSGQWNRPDLPGEIKVWDVANRKEVATSVSDLDGVFTVVLAKDGQSFFTGHRDGSIRQWRLP